MPASSYFSGLFGLGAGNPTPTVPLNSLMAPTPNDPSTTPLRGLLGALQDPQFRSDVGNGLLGPLVRAKNQAVGLLTDPIGNVKQTMDSFGQSVDRQRALMDLAFADPKNPLQITSPTALGEAANNMLTGPLGFAPVGMTVWHGSPHTFNAFDASKIGTGEGAQAYGHGIYTAESPDVARSYQILGGVELRDKAGKAVPVPPEAEWVANDLVRAGGDVGKVRASLAEHAKHYPWPAEMATRRLNEWEAAGLIPQARGNLYKVDLPDEHIAKMLDWDKPLGQQPQGVQSLVQELMQGTRFSPPQTGKDAVAFIGMRKRSAFGLPEGQDQAAAARALSEAGIPGIRYLDQGSRGAGQGTSNFVVFPGNEGLLSILERNGAPPR